MPKLKLMRLFLPSLWAVILLSCSPAMAAHSCGVERVKSVGDGVRIYMVSGYDNMSLESEGATGNIIVHADQSWQPVVRAKDGYFELHEGDRVILSERIHNSCSAAVSKNENKFGIEIKENTCFPRFGCTNSTELVMGE